MSRSWTIARTELTRLLRDRSNIFFVFVFPLLLVVLIGSQFGSSSQTRVGVVGPSGDLAAEELLDAIDALDGIATTESEDLATLRDEVARGLISAGVVIPDGYGEALRSVTPATVGFVGRQDATGRSLETLIASVLADQRAPGQAAAIAAARLDADASSLREVATGLGGQTPDIEVVTRQLGVDELGEEFANLGQFDLGASSQLFLFTFLTALTGGVALIQTRQYGIASRMLSTSTPLRTIVAGHAGGRMLIALLQAGYIIIATVLLFQVDWGDPVATGAVVVLFCLVAAGAGLIIGASLRNDSQAAGAAVGLGLGSAALGGSMVPLEIYPETIRLVARVTPHAWANEAMAEIVRRDGSLLDVLPQLGALAGMAVVLAALGTWQLRRTLTG